MEFDGGNAVNDGNAIRSKSKTFALRIIRMYQYLCNEKKNLFFQSRF